MGHLPADKYNVAWFKLAECIARGEKERALGVYRLLSHSIDNQAFSRQLEGDIFLSCNDKGAAFVKYAEAAQLYQELGKQQQAAAIYEHMVTLQPGNAECFMTLIQLYAELSLPAKIFSRAEALLQLDLDGDDLIKTTQMINELKLVLDVELIGQLYQQLIRVFVKRERPLQEVAPYLHKTADFLAQSSSKQALQQFVSELQEVNKPWSVHVQEYLKK